MKKYIPLLLILIGLNFAGKAQYATIPDTAFVNWLMGHGFAGCMSGNQLDTTCPAVLNAHALYCYAVPIRDLTGIRYFKNIDSLDCSNDSLKYAPGLPQSLWFINCNYNLLDTMPVLPSAMGTLECGFNHLHFIDTLPATLREFDCNNNPITVITSLPANLLWFNCSVDSLPVLPALPQTLDYLFSDDNELVHLPALPVSLLQLACSGNLLVDLPALPPHLLLLACDNNYLTALPALPQSVNYIHTDYNLLDSLPALPHQLQQLTCGYNKLTALPSLPPFLTILTVENNLLTALPVLPPVLQDLNCDYNSHLTSLPLLPNTITNLVASNCDLYSLPELPDSMNVFLCYLNPHLTCLPRLKRIVNFQFQLTGITCLPNYGQVTASTPALNTVPLCGIFNPNSCPVFWDISGQVYYDANNDCLYNDSDVAQRNVKVKLYNNGNLIQQAYTGNSGDYSFQVPYGNYAVKVDTLNLPFVSSCPLSGMYLDTLRASDSLSYNNNFASVCRPGFDVGVNSLMNDFTIPRPAAIINMEAIAGDMSQLFGGHCASGVSGSVHLDFNGPVSFVSVADGALPPTVVTANSVIWKINNYDTVDIYTAFNTVFQIAPDATPGTDVCFTMTVNPTVGDYRPANDTMTWCFPVANALDPNLKQAYPTRIDSAGEWVVYTIRFQNTGSAAAVNILVTDTLDSHLDPATFDLLTSSAHVVTQLFGNVVKFSFPNINLPDSLSGDSISRGYVQYRIQSVSNLLLNGALVPNTANIFFDLNPAVVTNTAVDTVVCAPSFTSLNRTICRGDTVYVGHVAHYTTGNTSDTLSNHLGCDSIVTLALTVNHRDTINTFSGLCAGDSIYFYGHYIHSPGTYDTLLPGGCDTLAILSLVVQDPLPPTRLYDTICNNEQVFFNGNLLTGTGIYTQHLNNINGCDSTINLNLTVYPTSIDSAFFTVCLGDTLNYAGHLITQSGRFVDTLTSQRGCDSVMILSVLISQPPADTTYRHVCQGDTVNFGSNYYSQAGAYNDTVKNGNCILQYHALVLTVDSLPVVTIERTCIQGGIDECWWSTVLTAQGVGSDSLSWTLNGQTMAGVTDTLSLSGNGDQNLPGTVINVSLFQNLYVCLTAFTNCGAITICDTTMLIGEGINVVNPNNLFHLYPNPADEYVMIDFDAAYTGGTIMVKDITGQQILQTQLTHSPQSIPTKDLPAGVYMVSLYSNGEVGTRLMIKE